MRKNGSDKRSAIDDGLREYEEQRPKPEDFDEEEYESAVIGAFAAETEEEFERWWQTFQKQESLLRAGSATRRGPGPSRG